MSRKVMKYRRFKDLVEAYKKGNLVDPIQIGKEECIVSIDRVGRVYENDTIWVLKAALEQLGVPFEDMS